ncbi:MAG: prepilin-type N-terminal cleavage/methylation domain-containing protein [Alphaproteobacteria bacterium]|nr:prepilin-type N-terminal cleavage/methylation domain-containing protein [Alphaproteobacteria bacterium]
MTVGKTYKEHKKIRGFTLVELSMVMIISGFVLVAALQAYATYIQKARHDEIYDDLSTVQSSIASYKSARGYYPCPADPDLPMSDPNAGKSDCTLLDNGTYPVGTCLNGICKVGGRDADGDGNPDAVLIGAVPYQALKEGSEADIALAQCTDVVTGNPLSTCDANGDGVVDANARLLSIVNYNSNTEDTSLDPWFYKMTYAVTSSMAAPMPLPSGWTGTFDPAHGAISIETPGPSPVSTISPPASAHYVLISHGENHMGAYNREGSITVPCQAGSYDYENCDNLNATFVNGIYSRNNNNQYYDDQIMYSVYSISTLWEFSANGVDIHNVNKGNVGVSKDTPEEALDVAGDLYADTTSQIQICNTSKTNCWSPAFISGDSGSGGGSSCPSGAPAGKFYAASAIRGGALYCDTAAPITPPSGFAGKSCPSGEFLRSVNTDGSLSCDTLPTP